MSDKVETTGTRNPTLCLKPWSVAFFFRLLLPPPPLLLLRRIYCCSACSNCSHFVSFFCQVPGPYPPTSNFHALHNSLATLLHYCGLPFIQSVICRLWRRCRGRELPAPPPRPGRHLPRPRGCRGRTINSACRSEAVRLRGFFCRHGEHRQVAR